MGWWVVSTAAERFTQALIDLRDEGGLPPCTRSVLAYRWWFSDDPTTRAQAAEWCAPCPVLTECAAAADELGERFGVFGGLDRTRPAGKTPTAPKGKRRPSR